MSGHEEYNSDITVRCRQELSSAFTFMDDSAAKRERKKMEVITISPELTL